jgi:flavin-dependent dehydrogenase
VHVDVAVVGGGPAGAAAAITLARAGRRVAILDKATFPRDKCCGDGLTTGALRLLDDLGLDPATVGSWQSVHDVVVVAPSGHEVTFPLPRGGGAFAAVPTSIPPSSTWPAPAGSRCSTATPSPASARTPSG